MMQAAAVAPRLEPRLSFDHVVQLRNVTWADYQRFLEIRGEHSVPRLTFIEGVLEIMTPSRMHESIKSTLGCLVEAWCMEKGVDITPYGSWTLESKEHERGAEPDECYVIGDVPEPERCDIAIEVVWSSGGLDKLDVYRKLGVREVWVWKEGAPNVFSLRRDRYVPIDRSELLPKLDLQQLLAFVEVRPMTRAVREYRVALSGGADR